MAIARRFVLHGDHRVCPRCGSLLGRYGDDDDFCPAPTCSGAGRLVPGVDPSYLYRARALLFVPQEESGTGEDSRTTGVIIAVKPGEVTSPVARRHAPVVATSVRWPEDRKHFTQLFDHHVHDVRGPLVDPLNDGWDASRSLPVL